jgi:uncharacterized membrane protein YidH (DUF202 family)
VSAAALTVEDSVTTEHPVAHRLGGMAGLREDLAVRRNALANERIFPAYLGTALVFVVAGIALVQLFSAVPVDVLGWVFVVLGAVTLVVGTWRFLRVTRCILQLANGAL